HTKVTYIGRLPLIVAFGCFHFKHVPMPAQSLYIQNIPGSAFHSKGFILSLHIKQIINGDLEYIQPYIAFGNSKELYQLCTECLTIKTFRQCRPCNKFGTFVSCTQSLSHPYSPRYG